MKSYRDEYGPASWLLAVTLAFAATGSLCIAAPAWAGFEPDPSAEEDDPEPPDKDNCEKWEEDDCGEKKLVWSRHYDSKDECHDAGGSWTDNPIRYDSGRVGLAVDDIPLVLSDRWFGHTRYFNNRFTANFDGLNGFNWTIAQLPHLVWEDNGTADQIDSGDVLIAYKGDTKPVYFDYDGSTFTARDDPKQRYQLAAVTLSDGSSSAGYRLTMIQNGLIQQVDYYDPAGSKSGVFFQHVSMLGPNGDPVTTQVIGYDYNRATELQRVIVDSGVTTTYSLVYDYFNAQHTNTFKLQYVTLRKKIDTGSWVEIRRTAYTYYGTSESYGTLNDLKTATQQIPDGSGGWNDVATDYYRYYKDADANGSDHMLKYVVNAESYRRLDDAVADPLTASDSEVADHADFYFEYDSGKVSKEVAKAGCNGCGSGGTEGDSFVRVTSTHADGYNNWKTKTTVTYADGDQEVVYSNHVAKPVAKVLIKDPAGTPQYWVWFFQYDAEGLLTLVANPSAISGFTPSGSNSEPAGVLTESGGNFTELSDSSGLIEVRGYYSSTTATSSTPGGVDNYLQYVAVKNGETATEKRLREKQYLKHSYNGDDVYPIGKEIAYPIEGNLTTKIETTYAYTWHEDGSSVETNRIESITTTLPAIASGQNGSGTSATTVKFFDAYGNPAWTKDERGSITKYVYDVPTGRLTQRIDDVDTDLVTDEPSGWSSPNGLHLVRDYTYDGLSRLVEVLGPEHTAEIGGTAKAVRAASWTVYKENGPSAMDQTWSGSGYYDTAATAYTLVDPVAIRVRGKDGNNTYESIFAKRSSGSGALSDTDTFNQSDYQRWTVNEYFDDGRLKLTRRYHTIPTSGGGSSGTNYDQTDFAYDANTGERIKIKTPDGSITRIVYTMVTGKDKIASMWVGTDDTGATASDPSNGGAGGNNMKKIAEVEYDSGNDEGDGNLTKVTLFVNDTAGDNRVTTFTYDFRNRRETRDGEVDRFSKRYYDNLDRITKVERYDTIEAAANLIARGEFKHDDRNRTYQTIIHEVDPTNGTVGNSLTSNTWYDDAGNVIKSQSIGSGKVFTKYAYDGLGRPTKTYTGYDTDETAYADTDDVTGDTILKQREYDYDASNLLSVTSRIRLDDATGTGELTTVSGSQPQARVVHQAFWYDGTDRRIASADYGTNADAAFTRPSITPAASDTILVSKTAYDDAGRIDTITDPKGIVNKTFYDDAGRQTHMVENYDVAKLTGGDPDTPASRNADVNRITAYTYTADGQVETLIAVDPNHDGNTADNQVTTYVYGTTLTDSDVASNRLLRAIIYPDSDDVASPLGNGTDTVYDRVELAYNRLGKPKTRKDPREVVYTLDYDKLGRLAHNRVTDTGRSAEAVDDAVLRITRAYEVRGMLSTVTSYDNATVGSGNVLNEVVLDYNDFEQLTNDFQEHDGVKDGNTHKVAYAYEDGSDATKQIRLNKVTYPNARDIHYLYADAGDTNGIGHVLGRVTALSSAATRGTDDANVIAGYTYAGLGTLVRKDYPTPDVRLDYIGSPGSGDGGYANFDRFGRVTAQQWEDYSGASDVDVFHIAHAYDRASNRLYADRKVYKSASQVYTHDDLHRLSIFKAGKLDPTANGGAGAVSDDWLVRKQAWTLDQLGNPLAIDTEVSTDFVKATFNAANEMTTRDSKSDQRRPSLSELNFNSSSEEAVMTNVGDLADSSSSDAFDVNTTNAGKMTITAVGQDTFDSTQEEEARTLVLVGEDIWHLGWETRITFPGAAGSGQAGFVFGFKNPNDYWLYVIDLAAQKRRIYHVVNGAKGSVLDEKNQSVSAGSGRKFDVDLFRSSLDDFFYTFADGYPSGQVGYYSNVADTTFDHSWANNMATTRDMAGRWDNYYGGRDLAFEDSFGWILEDEDKLKVVPDSVALLKGVRADRFEAVFSMQRQKSTSTDEFYFLFNADDSEHWQGVVFRIGSVIGQERVEGKIIDGVSMTDGPATMPQPTTSETLWLRVTSDGTTVKVYGKIAASEPSSWSETTDLVKTSTNFDFAAGDGGGGRIGLAGKAWQVRLDNFTLKTDRDANGSYETTEVIEDFTVDASGYAEETLTHDAAGNLTYDGVYQYAYDAWNRLVKVTKAYRDPASPSTVSIGSVVSEIEYDGQGRRIVKQVKNSEDLDATYHYYYSGVSMVEVRNGSDNVLKHQVWGLDYTDELIQVALNDDPADVAEDNVESFYYAMQDARFNVLGMVNSTGVMTERYEYTPYGERTVHFSPGTNDPDAIAPTDIGRRWIVGSTAQPYGLNDIGHRGLMHDEESNLIHNRARIVNPGLQRFLQRDPLTYVDGLSMVAYYPALLGGLDPLGLTCGECKPGKMWIMSITEVPTLPDVEPGEEEDMLADLDSIINIADWLNVNPFSVGKKAQDAAENIFDNGLEDQIGDMLTDKVKDFLKNELGFEGLPSTPWDMLKDQIRPVIDNYLEKRKENWHNLWIIVKYQACDCCCKKTNRGEWSSTETDQQRIEGKTNTEGHYSTLGRDLPDDTDKRDSWAKLKERLDDRKRRAECD